MNEESTRRNPKEPKSVVRDEAKTECVFHFGKVRLNFTPGTSIQNGILVYCGRNTVNGISTALCNILPRSVKSALIVEFSYVSKRFKALTIGIKCMRVCDYVVII